MKVKKIGIISLSKGIMREDFVAHELEIGQERLKQHNIEVEFLPHALKGVDFIKNHPECRAQDLLSAFQDDSIDVISGLLVGKPQNETYYDEYKMILLDELANRDLSIVYNVNVGHATPRCIIPFGVESEVNIKKQVITFKY